MSRLTGEPCQITYIKEAMFNFIVFGGSSVIVTAVLRTIRSFTNGKIIVLGDHDTQALRWSWLFQKHVAISLKGDDDEKCIRLLNMLAKTAPQSILIPCDCDAVRMTNRISNRITNKAIPFPDTALLNMFDDKWRFYEFCSRNALPTPDTFYIGTKDQCDFDAVVAKTGLPFILKPSNQAGSKGIEVIHSKEHYERSVSQNPRYVFDQLIAQRYIEGTDIDISLYSIRGKLSACAIQKTDNGRIHFTENAYLTSLAEILCEKTAYHGVMHIDARIDLHTGKVYLIESNPRFWASLTAAALCGLNFLEEVVAAPLSAKQEMKQLASGSVPLRLPLLDPSSWTALLFDRGVHGRMLRTMTFDVPALSSLIKSLPAIFRLKIQRKLSYHPEPDLENAPASLRLNLSYLEPGANPTDIDAVQSGADTHLCDKAVTTGTIAKKHSRHTATLS
jgi:predicted ATP-grasp superfamily ATP-dependent carboligase